MDNARAHLDLSQVLTIEGDGSADTVHLGRSASNPLMLELRIDGALEIHFIPESSVDAIVFNGLGGNDHLIIDTTYGLITPARGITFNGGPSTGTGDSLEFIGPFRRIEVSTATDVRVVSDVDGDMIIRTTGVERATQEATADSGLSTVLSGLLRLNAWAEKLNDAQHAAVPIPGFGRSAGSGVAGEHPPRGPALGRGEHPGEPAGEASSEEFDNELHSILRQIFETGTGALDLQSLMTSLTSMEELRAALDGLDSTAGNVTYRQVGGTTTFNMIVNKTLSGQALLDVEALGGALRLNGEAEISADVRLHLVFGFDESGFFLDPDAAVNDDGDPEPELIISNFSADAEGSGRLGFLEVELENGRISADPAVKLKIDLVDPGTDPLTGLNDHVIRLNELASDVSSLAHTTLEGNPSGDDVTVEGEFAVSAVLPGGSEPFELADARLKITWADVNDISTATISASAGAGSGATALRDMIQTTSAQVLSGLQSAANWMRDIASQNILGTIIPLLNKSLGDILDEFPAPLIIDNTTGETIYDISDVYSERGANKFVVSVAGLNLSKAGVSIGDRVTYEDTTDHSVTGEIDVVSVSGFVVSFASSLHQDPNTADPSFSIHRRGSLEKRLGAALGDLSNITSMSARAPTLQEIVGQLARTLGIDPSQIPISYDAAAGSIEFTPTFDVDPLTFSQRLDFGEAIPGLSISGGGDVSFTVDPSFQLTVGMKLNTALSWEDRFYIRENDVPEVTLNISAQLDRSDGLPLLTGSLGFLDVALAKSLSITPNDGIVLAATVTVNVTDPGVGAGDDYITISELTVTNLPRLFSMGIDGSFDIDGLTLSAAVGTSTLGTVTVSLDGASEGHVDSIDDLRELPGVLLDLLDDQMSFQNFLAFDNITPQMILDALAALVEQLHALGGAGLFVDVQLPLINTSISDLMNLAEEFSHSLGPVDDVDSLTVSTAHLVEEFLNDSLDGITVHVVVNPGDIRFNFTYTAVVDEMFPVEFNLGDAGSFFGVDTSGNVRIIGSAAVDVSLGLNTADGLDLDDRVFLGTDGNQIRLSGSANSGYTVAGVPDLGAITVDVSGFGRHFSVRDARAYINLGFNADLVGGATTMTS
jgi:hypothetical protein